MGDYDDDYDLMAKVSKSEETLLCSFRGGSRDRLFFLRRRSLARDFDLKLRIRLYVCAFVETTRLTTGSERLFYVSSGKMSPLVDVVSAFNWFAVARKIKSLDCKPAWDLFGPDIFAEEFSAR